MGSRDDIDASAPLEASMSRIGQGSGPLTDLEKLELAVELAKAKYGAYDFKINADMGDFFFVRYEAKEYCKGCDHEPPHDYLESLDSDEHDECECETCPIVTMLGVEFAECGLWINVAWRNQPDLVDEQKYAEWDKHTRLFTNELQQGQFDRELDELLEAAERPRHVGWIEGEDTSSRQLIENAERGHLDVEPYLPE